ncbi:hypothetical protein GCM10020219_073890 [Nonomuraea dietziae]
MLDRMVPAEAEWAPDVFSVHERFDQPGGLRRRSPGSPPARRAERGERASRFAGALPGDSRVVVTVEVEAGGGKTEKEAQAGGLGVIGEMRHDVVHVPAGAQGRCGPPLRWDGLQISDQCLAFGVDHGPGLVHGCLSLRRLTELYCTGQLFLYSIVQLKEPAAGACMTPVTGRDAVPASPPRPRTAAEVNLRGTARGAYRPSRSGR